MAPRTIRLLAVASPVPVEPRAVTASMVIRAIGETNCAPDAMAEHLNASLRALSPTGATP